MTGKESPDAIYQDLRKSINWFRIRKILKGFYHIWAWLSFGHVTSIILLNFHFHVPERIYTKFGLKWPSGFLEKQVLIFIFEWPWTKVKN